MDETTKCPKCGNDPCTCDTTTPETPETTETPAAEETPAQ
jgi:hypothetical protein